MENNNGIEFQEIISENDLKAYQTYIQLTSYENYYKFDRSIFEINYDYSSRDVNFPVDLLIKE